MSRTAVTCVTSLTTILALTACSGNPLAGQASAEEVCTDVAQVVRAAQEGTLPAPQDLLGIETRLRVGVDDPAVQEAGAAFRDEALAAAETIRTSGAGALPEIGPGIIEAGLAMGPACEKVGVPLG